MDEKQHLYKGTLIYYKRKTKYEKTIFFSLHKQLTFQSGFQSFRLPVEKISDEI